MQQRNNLALNGIQKNLIEGTLKFYFEDIAEQAPQVAIKALHAMTQDEISQEDLAIFKQLDIFSSIHTIREILAHPCPQNRTTNYPYFEAPRDPALIVYKNANGTAEIEPKGMLSLTAKNDHTAPPVTKEALITYIHCLINAALLAQEKKLTPGQPETNTMNHPDQTEQPASQTTEARNRVTLQPDHLSEVAAMVETPRTLAGNRNRSQNAFHAAYEVSGSEPDLSSPFSAYTPLVLPHLGESLFFLQVRNQADIVETRSDRIMRETVQALQAYGFSGLTVHYLKENWIPLPPETRYPQHLQPFTECEKEALIYLVTGKAALYHDRIPDLPLEQRLPIDRALAEMTKLCSNRCLMLVNYYSYGLRGDHLRNWQPAPGESQFFMTSGYQAALEDLILKDNVPPDQAIQRISQITEEQAWDIMREIHQRQPSHF